MVEREHVKFLEYSTGEYKAVPLLRIQHQDPWIYNSGLVVTGAVASIYALYLAYVSSSKLSVYASAFIFIAGIFLALIEVYPAGTRPHVFVSTWFFVQMWMAIVASSLNFIVRRVWVAGHTLLALAVLGPFWHSSLTGLL